MTAPDELLKYFGTTEVIQPSQQVQVGDLSYLTGSESIGHICWKGHEVIRAITWPIRDADWGTMRPTVIATDTELAADHARHHLHFQAGGAALDCRVSIRCQASGELQVSIKMLAHADFPTNRAGFTVLHPISGVAGSPLQVTHGDGSVEYTRFPTLISPDQPVLDIVGLRHELQGVDIDIRFDGEVFEMEDQRNWSDASYKTYCVPLVYPFTYTIAENATVEQSITVKLSGGEYSASAGTEPPPHALVELDGRAPQIGLAADAHWAVSRASHELVARCGVQFILARLELTNDDVDLAMLMPWIEHQAQALDLEIVLCKDTPLTGLTRLAEQLRAADIRPAHVVALPEAYLASYQPGGPWPPGSTPREALQAARQAFPEVAIGTGVLTNFTELNRCRPDARQGDYVTHANTAIVHAADDRSVMQTLEALPQVFTSTQALCHSRPCRLGLVSIGARTNPYGSAPAANPRQTRLALAQADPRQRGLFAAAWAVGILGTTANQPIEAITLAAATGPFGLVWQPQDYPQPGFDEVSDALIFPLFHIVRAASGMSSHPRVGIDDLPAHLVAYGVKATAGYQLLLANTSDESSSVLMDQTWQIRILDTHSFDDAVRNPDWLQNCPVRHSNALTLQPYATAFLTRAAIPPASPPRHDY